MQQQRGDQDLDIVIVQCCQNCQSHQMISRHSQWKYFQQFNEIKRKIERFVNNVIVIKNPIPDELSKSNQKNMYVNKNNNEKVIYPRVGAFEIYIYNILIFSKLISNTWPNHYKIVQLLTSIIQDKKKGNPIDHYSVYQVQQTQHQQIKSPVKQTRERKQIKQGKQTTHSSKKKKTFIRIYKSKDKAVNLNKTEDLKEFKEVKEIKEKKIGTLDPIIKQTKPKVKQTSKRYIETKQETRQKLPPLYNTISFSKQQQNQNFKNIFNSIEQLEQEQISMIEKKELENNNYDSLILNNNQESIAKERQSQNFKEDDMKFVENKSVQYSVREPQKDFMNTSIQYEEEEGRLCDFGLQIDDLTRPKENIHQFIQTILTGNQSFKNQPPKKPYMLDEQVEASIPLIKNQTSEQVQTIKIELKNQQINTQIINYVNRSAQFPQEVIKVVQHISIDTQFAHLYEKRKNIIDNQYYSVDKFEEKKTKYKWIGRASLLQNDELLKKKIFTECLVFSVYNFFGIKTSQKRLSYQHCGNVVADKMKQACYHVLTLENPELHYPFHFEQSNFQKQMFPLSEQLTFKNSKQSIKLVNYGGFLAVAYFLNDDDIFHQTHIRVGFVISNQQVKQIHKLSAENYELHRSSDKKSIGVAAQHRIDYDRLSSQVQLQFISMLSRITSQQTNQQLPRYIREIFIHLSPTYQHYKATVLSLRSDKLDNQLVQDFIKMLQFRIERIREDFKGQIYSFNKYHCLKPTITYNSTPQVIILRRIKYENRVVGYSQVLKNLIRKDCAMIITGQSGIGKTTLLNQLVKKLKETDKINLIYISQVSNNHKSLKNQIQQNMKNIVAIDNAEKYHFQIRQLINEYVAQNQISFCLLSSDETQVLKLTNQLRSSKLVHLTLLPFSKQEAQNFMMKSITSNTFTAKKAFVQQFTTQLKYKHIYSNPFYLFQFCKILSTYKLQDLTLADNLTTKYSILKQAIILRSDQHKKEMNEMGISYKECIGMLRLIALEYLHYDESMKDSIIGLIKEVETDDIIRNQLAYYPINIDKVNKLGSILFSHRQFLYYYVVEAYSYFLEKGYRNMKIQKLVNNNELVAMITQKYKLERTHERLLEVIYNTRKFKNTFQQASNAITLLVKMGYVFTNLNLDDVIISDGNLSNGVFYNCTFRGARMQRVHLYRTQLIQCLVDNAQMANINLLTKKFQLEFLALSTSLSPDGKNVAVGCGNYLIIINTDSGKEVKRIEAHLDVIRTVKYSKDGGSLVTIGDDKTLRIWDTHTYRCVVFKLPQKGSITYTNETEMIASVAKHVLKMWNIKSMAGDIYCEGHTDLITCVDFSKDGKWVVTGSKDTTLRLWDLQGKEKSIFNGHNSQIIIGRLSFDNRLLFSCSKDKDLVIWDTTTKSQIKIKKFTQEITQICPDLQEQYIVIALYNKSALIVLSYSSLEVKHILSSHTSRILSISFDNHYNRLVSLGKDKCVMVWDFKDIMMIENASKKYSIHDGSILALVYHRADKKYITSHQNGEINIWDASNNTLMDQMFSHNGPVRCLGLDKNNRLYSAGSDGCIRVWDLTKTKQPKELKVHAEEIVKLKISNRSKVIASSSTANELVIQDITGINILVSTREEGRIYAIDFSKEDRLMAIGGSEKYIIIYQLNPSANSLTRLEELGQHTETIQCLAFHADVLLIASTKDGVVSIWNHQKANLLKKIQNSSTILTMMPILSKYICMSSDDGKIRIIDMDEAKQIKVFKFSQQTVAIDTNNQSTLLYAATNNGNLLIWNLYSLRQMTPKINFDRMAIDGDCATCYLVDSSKTLLKRDLVNHREEIITLNIDSQIDGVSFVQDQVVLLLKSGRLWQLGKGEYRFPTETDYEGDLFYMRDTKQINLFRTQMKKAKGIKPPIQLLLDIKK